MYACRADKPSPIMRDPPDYGPLVTIVGVKVNKEAKVSDKAAHSKQLKELQYHIDEAQVCTGGGGGKLT